MGFLYHLTFFSACLAFLYSLSQAIHPQSSKKRKTIAMAFLFSGLILANYPYVNSSLFQSFPYLFSFHLPFLFLISPVLARLLFLFLEEEIPGWLRSPVHFVPGILSVLFYLPIFLLPAEEKVRMAKLFFEGGALPSPFRYGPLLSIFHIFFYIGISMYLLFGEFRLKRLYEIKSLRLVILLLCVSIVSASGGLLITLGYRNLGFFLGYFFLSLVIPEIFLIQVRYPSLFEEARTAIEEERKYQNSQLSKINLTEIQRGLYLLFNEKKIFLKDGISLSSVAKELELSTHQLSEYLNTVEKKTFSQFVNSFRLSFATNLFREKPDWPVLRIAYESGFQSKSAFNEAFKKEFSENPTDYRKKNRSVL